MKTLQIGVRAFTTQHEERREAQPVPEHHRHPRFLLVLDTEARTDETQRLSFASYRLARINWRTHTAHCIEEGLIYPDDLPETDPQGFEVLRDYVLQHRPEVDLAERLAVPRIALRPLSGFLADVWRPQVEEGLAILACFNVGFDLARLASGWGEARARRGGKRSSYERGYSLILFPHEGKASRYRKRVLIKHLDSKRALKGLGNADE
jgi:hypothetical protein